MMPGRVSSVEIVQGLVKDFRRRFNALKKATIHCLEKCKFTVMTVLFTLTSIPAVKEHKGFLKEEHKALSQSESHMEMFSLLNLYWNYLSYHLLDQLIEALNLEQPAFNPITAEMAVYKNDLHVFMKQTTLQVYCQVEPPRLDDDPPPGFRKMVVKFDWPLTATLEDVEKFRQQYARCYDLQTCAMMLSSIGTGSFTATWFLPTSVVKVLVNNNALTVFKEFSVTEVVLHTSTEICVYPTHEKVSLFVYIIVTNEVIVAIVYLLWTCVLHKLFCDNIQMLYSSTLEVHLPNTYVVLYYSHYPFLSNSQ